MRASLRRREGGKVSSVASPLFKAFLIKRRGAWRAVNGALGNARGGRCVRRYGEQCFCRVLGDCVLLGCFFKELVRRFDGFFGGPVGFFVNFGNVDCLVFVVVFFFKIHPA